MTPTIGNLNYFKVLNSTDVAVGSVTAVNGSILIKGLQNSIDPASISSYSITAYAAGTKSVTTVTPGTVADLTLYSITVKRVVSGDPNGLTTPPTPVNSKTYFITTGVSDSATTLAGSFRTAIAADLQAFVVASGTTTLILTASDLISDFTVDITNFPSTKNNGTPYVAPAGTPTIVGAIDPTNVSSSGQYRTYQITYHQSIYKGAMGNSYVGQNRTAVIFADELATNFAAFNTRLTQVLANNPLNNLIQFGLLMPSPQAVAINLTATATAAQMLAGVITSTTAAAVALTTPTAAAIWALIPGAQVGTTFDLIIDCTAGSNAVTLTLDSTISAAKQVSSGDTAAADLLVVTNGATTGVGIFRFYFSSATAATCIRIG